MGHSLTRSLVRLQCKLTRLLQCARSLLCSQAHGKVVHIYELNGNPMQRLNQWGRIKLFLYEFLQLSERKETFFFQWILCEEAGVSQVWREDGYGLIFHSVSLDTFAKRKTNVHEGKLSAFGTRWNVLRYLENSLHRVYQVKCFLDNRYILTSGQDTFILKTVL